MDAVVYSAVKKNQAKLKNEGESITEARLLHLATDDKVYLPQSVPQETLYTAGGTADKTCTALDTSRVYQSWRDTSDSSRCKHHIVTISGKTITAGTQTTVLSNPSENMESVFVSTDKILLVYGDASANSLYCRCYPITGTTIGGTTTLTVDASNSADYTTMDMIDTDRALMNYKGDLNGETYANILDVSGTTVTLTTWETVSTDAIFNHQSCLVATNKQLLMYRNGTDLIGRIINVSGSTITVETEYTLISSNIDGNTDFDIVKIDTDKILLVYNDTTNNINSCLISVSGNVLSAGTSTSFHENDSHEFAQIELEYIEDNKVCCLHLNDTGVTYYLSNRVIAIDGTTVTAHSSKNSLFYETDMALFGTDRIYVAERESFVIDIDENEVDNSTLPATGYCDTRSFNDGYGYSSVPYYSF